MPVAASTKKETMAEMAAALLRIEGEKVDVVRKKANKLC